MCTVWLSSQCPFIVFFYFFVQIHTKYNTKQSKVIQINNSLYGYEKVYQILQLDNTFTQYKTVLNSILQMDDRKICCQHWDPAAFISIWSFTYLSIDAAYERLPGYCEEQLQTSLVMHVHHSLTTDVIWFTSQGWSTYIKPNYCCFMYHVSYDLVWLCCSILHELKVSLFVLLSSTRHRQ